MKILRPYQLSAKENILRELETNRSTLLCLATGLGKTACASSVALEFTKKGQVLFLAHTDELIAQAKRSLEEWTGLEVGVEKANLYVDTDMFRRCPIIVSSIQTQISGKPGARRYLRFKPQDFSLVIADEAHMSLAPSWREVLGHYQTKLLGLTATPKRTDELAMGQLYDSVAMNFGILEGVSEGWLVDIVQQIVAVKGLDFSKIKTTAGDLNAGQLAAVMEQEENIHGICQPVLEGMFALEPKTLSAMPPIEWKPYLAGLGKIPRKTLIYVVSVAQAELCAKVFLRALDGIEWLCGKTNKEVRREMIVRFAKGLTHGLVNVGCLTHGFDEPGVELIAMARATKSASLYLQILGRGTRPPPGVVDGLETKEERLAAIKASAKPFIRLMDFKGNAGKHKIISCVDVLSGKTSPAAVERARQIAEEGKPKRIIETMTQAQFELEKMQREAQKRAEEAAEAKRKHVQAQVDYTLKGVDPFARRIVVTGVAFSNDGRKYTDHQVKVLSDWGIDPRKKPYRQGCAIYYSLVKKPSPRMAKKLMEYGYSAEQVKVMSRKQAHAAIDAIANNGWKKPTEPVSAGQAARLEVAGKDAP